MQVYLADTPQKVSNQIYHLYVSINLVESSIPSNCRCRTYFRRYSVQLKPKHLTVTIICSWHWWKYRSKHLLLRVLVNVNSLCCLVVNYHYRSLLTNLWYFKTNRCPYEPVPLLQGVDNQYINLPSLEVLVLYTSGLEMAWCRSKLIIVTFRNNKTYRKHCNFQGVIITPLVGLI